MMDKTICPGQDTRYWKPEDVFDIECSHCGKMLEFFKDEARRKCPGCGNRIQNPKLSFGCAQWCDHAKECLGYDPKETLSDDFSGEETSLAEKIVNELKKELGEDSTIYINARNTLKFAKKLLAREEGNPRIIIPASLLMFIDYELNAQQGKNGEEQSLSNAERIMKQVDLDTDTIDSVCEIINNYHATENPQNNEEKILSDSYKLALINDAASTDATWSAAENAFFTETAPELVKEF